MSREDTHRSSNVDSVLVSDCRVSSNREVTGDNNGIFY